MAETGVDNKYFVPIGIVFLVLTVILVTMKTVTGLTIFGLSSTIVIAIFAFWHGTIRYGWKKMLFFFVVIFIVSWTYETVSILTGFPFGHYNYSTGWSPMLGLVPVMIMPAYFAMGYLSWTIGSILLDKRDSSVSGCEIILLPVISSFVMVMWDICMDPINSTIDGLWIWHNGGVYLGVPFVNFLGWFLCVFTFYMIFVFFLKYTDKGESPGTPISLKAFWILPVLLYASRTIEFFGDFALGSNYEVTAGNGHVYWTGDIYGTLALMTIFTMIFVAFYAIARVYLNNNPVPTED